MKMSPKHCGLKACLRKRVIVRNKTGALYFGILSGFRFKKNQFCLTHLAILNRKGKCKAISGTPESRWFDMDRFEVVGMR